MEFFQIVQGEDPWDQIPTDVACQIISQIIDLDDLERTRRVSQTFNRLARLCTQQVDANRKIVIPVSYFADFRNLQIVGDNIILEVRPKDLALLSTMPSLREANFNVGHFVQTNILEFGISVAILQQLQLDRKLPRVNFRFVACYSYQMSGLILQGDQFTTMDLPLEVAREIMQAFPQLQYVPLLMDRKRLKRLMSRKIREVLRVGEFGLLDPSRPPSDNNIPLSKYLRRLADSGLGNVKLLELIFKIYAFNNGLLTATTITPDALLDRLFREDFIRYNQILTPDRRPIDPDKFLRAHLSISISQETSLHSIEDIADYDLPMPLSDQDYTVIERAVKTARQNKNVLQSMQKQFVRVNHLYNYICLTGRLVLSKLSSSRSKIEKFIAFELDG